jgi:hypothetical protein
VHAMATSIQPGESNMLLCVTSDKLLRSYRVDGAGNCTQVATVGADFGAMHHQNCTSIAQSRSGLMATTASDGQVTIVSVSLLLSPSFPSLLPLSQSIALSVRSLSTSAIPFAPTSLSLWHLRHHRSSCVITSPSSPWRTCRCITLLWGAPLRSAHAHPHTNTRNHIDTKTATAIINCHSTATIIITRAGLHH